MQLEKFQDQKPECHLEWPYTTCTLSVVYAHNTLPMLFAHLSSGAIYTATAFFQTIAGTDISEMEITTTLRK